MENSPPAQPGLSLNLVAHLVYGLLALGVLSAGMLGIASVAAINVLPLSNNEKVNALIDLDQVEPTMLLLMVTERGYIKKTVLEEFKNVRRNGLIAISLSEGDHLAEVRVRSSGEAEDNARLMAAISKATGGVA